MYGLEQLSSEEALEAVTVPEERVPAGLVSVLAAGEVKRTRALGAWDAWDVRTPVLEHGGRYYRRGGYSYEGRKSGWERTARIVLGVLGTLLLHTHRSGGYDGRTGTGIPPER